MCSFGKADRAEPPRAPGGPTVGGEVTGPGGMRPATEPPVGGAGRRRGVPGEKAFHRIADP